MLLPRVVVPGPVAPATRDALESPGVVVVFGEALGESFEPFREANPGSVDRSRRPHISIFHPSLATRGHSDHFWGIAGGTHGPRNGRPMRSVPSLSISLRILRRPVCALVVSRGRRDRRSPPLARPCFARALQRHCRGADKAKSSEHDIAPARGAGQAASVPRASPHAPPQRPPP